MAEKLVELVTTNNSAESCADKDVIHLNMERHRDKLVDAIESEFGLLDKLLKIQAVTYSQLEQIQSESRRIKKNEMILDYIFKNRKFSEFINALSESRQTHVVNWIVANGEYKNEFDLGWPLTVNENQILDANQEELVDILDTCELIPKLYSREVINSRQRDAICSKPTNHEKNEALLGIVRRLSQKSYITLINCLRETNQGHIADILVNGGAIVRVHATLGNDNLDEIETQIVQKMTDILMENDISMEQASRLLNATQFNIAAVKRGESIVLYICCNIKEFNRLCNIIDSSEMRNILNFLFNLLIHNIEIRVLSVKILKKDIVKAKQSLKKLKELKERTAEGDDNFKYKFRSWLERTLSSKGKKKPKTLLTHNIPIVETSESIANFSCADTVVRQNEEFEDQRKNQEPEESWRSDIHRHYEFIVDRMLPDSRLIDHLYDSFILATSEKKQIKATTSFQNKNKLILNICLSEKYRLKKLIEALGQCDQRHLMNYLKHDGKYREEFGGEWPLTEKEVLIIRSNYEVLIQLIEIDVLIGLLYETGVLNTEHRRSILSHFRPCDKNRAFLEILERCSLCSYWQTITCLHQSNQSQVAAILEAEGTISSEVHNSQMTVNSLPLELLDAILRKSFAIFTQRNNENNYGKYENIIKQLAEVSYCWFTRINKRRFKSAFWSHLSSVNKSQSPFLLSYKSKQQFVEENLILLEAHKRLLKASDVLTDLECAITARKSSAIKKSQSTNTAAGLSVIVNIRNEVKLEAVVKFLRKAGQKSMVKVIENHGAAVRVEIKRHNSKRTRESAKQILALKDKTIFRDIETQEAMGDFKNDDDFEIFAAVEDRDVVFWIWCKSSNAIEKLKKINETEGLAQLFNQLSKKNVQFLNEKNVNLDKDQLKNKVIVLFSRLIVDPVASLDIQPDFVRGVTKLKNKIYALCQERLKIFDDRNSFALLETIEIKDVWNAFDIVSYEKESVLYILDGGIKHSLIWKNKQNIEESFIVWLEFVKEFEPYAMSITDSGHLLMVTWYPSAILRIYDSDAELNLSISLSDTIKTPLHAVETSTGNFVIVHRVWNHNFDRRVLAVSVLNRNRQIIHNFTPKTEEQRLLAEEYYSSYLCIDSEDRVFVADRVSGRVILLDSELNWKQTVVQNTEVKTNLRYPSNMFYDEKCKQLIVGEGEYLCGSTYATVYSLTQL